MTSDAGGYRAILAVGDARLLLLSSLVGRLPIAMAPLAVLLAVREATGSFETAGIAAGAFAACNAASAPALGRTVDRVGPRRVLLAACIGQGVCLLALAALAAGAAAPTALVLLSALAGAMVPPTSACARALWSDLARTPAHREAAYSLEAISQEVAFTVGPTLVAAGVALASPVVTVVMAALFSVVGNGIFAGSSLCGGRQGHPPVERRGHVLAHRRLRAVLGSVAFVGMAFGGIQVGLSALAVDLHAKDTAGVMLGLCGLGSLVGGLVYGARAWTGSVDRRYVGLLLLAGVAAGPLLLPDAVGPALLLSAFAGIAYAPALSCHYTLVERLAPRQAITEAFTWSNASLISGMAIGSAVAGWLVEHASADAALALVCASMAISALIALTPRHAMTAALADPGDGSAAALETPGS